MAEEGTEGVIKAEAVFQAGVETMAVEDSVEESVEEASMADSEEASMAESVAESVATDSAEVERGMDSMGEESRAESRADSEADSEEVLRSQSAVHNRDSQFRIHNHCIENLRLRRHKFRHAPMKVCRCIRWNISYSLPVCTEIHTITGHDLFGNTQVGCYDHPHHSVYRPKFFRVSLRAVRILQEYQTRHTMLHTEVVSLVKVVVKVEEVGRKVEMRVVAKEVGDLEADPVSTRKCARYPHSRHFRRWKARRWRRAYRRRSLRHSHPNNHLQLRRQCRSQLAPTPNHTTRKCARDPHPAPCRRWKARRWRRAYRRRSLRH